MLLNDLNVINTTSKNKIFKRINKYKYTIRITIKNFILNIFLYIKGQVINVLLKFPLIRQYYKNYLLTKFKNKAKLMIPHLYKPIVPWLISSRPIILEIGSGHGEVAQAFCKINPNINNRFNISTRPLMFTAEYTKRFYELTKRKVKDCTYIIPIYADGYRLAQLFAPDSIDLILIMFPDPWHKRRHHKRRPLNVKNLRTFYTILKPEGHLLIATDHKEYFDFVIQQLQLSNNFDIQIGRFSPKEWGLPYTHYYRKWNRSHKESLYIFANPRKNT